MGKEMENLNVQSAAMLQPPEIKMEQTESMDNSGGGGGPKDTYSAYLGNNKNEKVMITNMTNLTTNNTKRENNTSSNTKFETDIIDINLNKGDSNQSNSSFSSQVFNFL